MSKLSYNDIPLPFERLGGHEADIEVENGHTVRTRHVITVATILTPDITGLILPGETFSQMVRRVQHALEVPRKALYFGHDSLTINVPEGGDAHLGPQPELLSWTDFVGRYSVHLTFRVTVWVRECGNTLAPSPAWTYHAWRESVDVDELGATTLRRSGVMRFRGDRAVTPDAFRGLVTPYVPAWFLPQSSRYAVQEDGLALAYEFVHVEQYALPPEPAVKAEGRYDLVTINAAKMQAQVSLTLSGRMDGSKQRLLETAIAVALERLKRGIAPSDKNGRWHITGAISEDLYLPRVSVQLRCLATPPAPPVEATNSLLTNYLIGARFGPAWSIFNVLFPDKTITKVGGNAGRLDAAGGQPLPRGMSKFGFDQLPLWGWASDPDAAFGGFGQNGKAWQGHGLRGSATELMLVAHALGDQCVERYIEGVTVGRPLPNDVVQGPPSGQTPPPPPPITPPPGVAPPGRLPPPPPPPSRSFGSETRGAAGGTKVVADVRLFSGAIPSLAELVNLRPQTSPGATDGAVWTVCELNGRYETDHGKIAHVEMKENGLTRVAQVRAKSIKYVVEWYAERHGQVPEVPVAEPSDSNFSLLHDSFEPKADVGADAQTGLYTAAGRYEYAVIDPSLIKYAATVTPWLAELGGKRAAAPVILGGPEIMSPVAVTQLVTGDLSPWQRALQQWLSTRG